MERHSQRKTTEDVKLKEPIDLMNLLPKEMDSFQYNGSLTTPPCSEGVKWVILKEPIEMSKEQIDKFREIFYYNNRPVQPLNKREVKEYWVFSNPILQVRITFSLLQ